MDISIIQQLAAQALVIIAPVVVAALAVWAHGLQKSLKALLEAKIGKENMELLQEAAHIGVRAAEQAGIVAKIALEGHQKKTIAYQVAEDYLKSLGIVLDLDPLGDIIEAAVNEELDQPEIVADAVAVENLLGEH